MSTNEYRTFRNYTPYQYDIDIHAGIHNLVKLLYEKQTTTDVGLLLTDILGSGLYEPQLLRPSYKINWLKN